MRYGNCVRLHFVQLRSLLLLQLPAASSSCEKKGWRPAWVWKFPDFSARVLEAGTIYIQHVVSLQNLTTENQLIKYI
uniref:Putative secreted protein n=1 Tax=Anopheles darlingi TaxID=43151 RepID=A0A2M4D406_ANODA